MNNANFNRQFILIDFRLLEVRGFLDFLRSSEFATYLVLRKNIWRSSTPHYMGLHNLYSRKQLLACSLEREKISEITGVDPDNISRHLSKLVKKDVIKRKRTGRQNIYVLGEWVDVRRDGSYKLEWFYLEGKYGISKSDLTVSVKSDLSESSDQTRRSASDNNTVRKNKKENTVNGGIELLKRIPDLDQPDRKADYVAKYILEKMKDKHSARFYRLVAAKIPEATIRRIISEIKADGAKNPGKVFTYKVKLWALEQQKSKIAAGLGEQK